MTNLQAVKQEISNVVFFAQIGQKELATVIFEDIKISAVKSFLGITITMIELDGTSWFQTENSNLAVNALAYATYS